MIVIDRFIPEQFQEELYNIFSSDKFLWTYQACTYKSFVNPDTTRFNDVHFLGRQLSNEVSQQKEYEYIAPLIYFIMEHTTLKIKNILRSKVNLILPSTDTRLHPPHKDSEIMGTYTLLLYLNDSDGDTVFFDDKLNETYRVSPKRGRAVIFPSNLLHCGNNPANLPRLAINIIFSAEDYGTERL